MAHGDCGVDGGYSAVPDLFASPIVSLCESSIFKGGIRVAAPIENPTTTFLEFRNQSGKWVAFRLKCTHPSHFTVKPQSVGLIAPKESQELRLTLLTNYDKYASYQLLIETTFIPVHKIQGHIGKQEVYAIWNEATKSDITTTRFPIYVCNVTDGTPPPKLYVFFDEPPAAVPVPTVVDKGDDQVVQQMKIIMGALLRNEKFFAHGLDLLLIISLCIFMYYSCVMVFRTFF